ncbi:MAG: hypothetical protein J5661_02370 [Bacteroidaceae bacterium]|nr:hypothetical protein [Bacteroidaceae bacterium]
MELILKRIAKKKSYTIGKLGILPAASVDANVNVDEGTYFCDTLEPPVREVKTKSRGGITQKPFAIPEGRYPVVITYSPKFKKWLPLLLNVPQFSGIRIHAGNTPRDTAGCILVGENKQVGQLQNSTLWLNRLKQKIVEAKERGEGVWIRVI